MKLLREGEQQQTTEDTVAHDEELFAMHGFYPLRVSDNKESIVDRKVCSEKAIPMFMNLIIENRKCRMEIDTGSLKSVISEKTLNEMFSDIKIERTYTILFGYDHKPLPPLGQLRDLTVSFNKYTRKLNCLVMPGSGPSLIGREWLRAFELWPLKFPVNTVNEVKKLNAIDVHNMIVNKFKKLFSPEPGTYDKGEMKLYLKENVKPVALKARHVPYALKEKIEREIARLESLGHLVKVEASEWATPIVPIIKSNGDIRICGDFKLTVNPHIVVHKHPIPRIDDIFGVLQGGKTFSQLDLKHAYMQIPVNEESRAFLTIVTHRGLYRYTKIAEGIASGPGDFQEKIENCIRDCAGAIAFLDNIYVSGSTNEEHMQNLTSVCARLEESGLKLNKAKCEFMKDRIEVLGFVIDKDGLHKSRSKVEAMVKAPRPTTFIELDSFLGLVNFYARFLKQRSDHLKPLYDCAKEKKLKWNDKCDEAFKWVKSELISPRVLAHFDPNETVVLACDASTYGLSAILSHKYKDGTERLIAYASKKIPTKELNRAIIHKEASAIVFGFKRFYDFIFGRKIILRTDHKPLEFILGPKKGIPITAASRLQRWCYYLSGFQYEIEHIKSENNGNCDALSRLPINDDLDIFDSDFSPLYYVSNGAKSIDYSDIALKIKSDSVLSSIVKYTLFGWPENARKLSDDEKKYFAKRF